MQMLLLLLLLLELRSIINIINIIQDTLESIIPPPRSSKSAISYVTRKTELFQRYLSIYPSIYLSIYLSRAEEIYLSIYPFIYLSIYLSRAEEMVPSRPWSATEPRWNADRMFHVKKKGWEGLARKTEYLLNFFFINFKIYVLNLSGVANVTHSYSCRLPALCL